MNNKTEQLFYVSLVIALLVLIAYESYRLHEVVSYNIAIRSDKLESVASMNTLSGRLVNAYLLQQKQEFEESLSAYTALIQKGNSEYQQRVNYNLANLYLQRAIRLLGNGDTDLAIPLIELAKVSYREILRNDNKYWPAKYNLELTLRLLPDVRKADPEDDVLPERSPEAIGTLQSRDLLP